MTDTERAELKRRAALANETPVISDGPIWRDFRRAANPAAVLDLLRERDEALAAWETLHKRHAADVLANGDEVSRLKAETERLRDLLLRAAGVLRDLAGMPIEADLLEAQVKEDT